MKLKDIKPSRIVEPFTVLLYGPEGIGKSTWASEAPAPLFLGVEQGTAELETSRYPGALDTWDRLLHAVDTVRLEEHDFETLVIDTVDAADRLAQAHICARDHQPNIEGYGYGKGYTILQAEWVRLMAKLDALIADRKTNVVMLGHAIIKPFNNPDGVNFDRYTVRLHDKCASIVKEWAKCVLFANYEVAATRDGARGKAFSSGTRVVYTENRGTFDAKNRYSLPAKMPLSFEVFETARKNSGALLRVRLQEALAELATVHPEAHAKASLAVSTARQEQLLPMLNRIQSLIAEKQNVE